MKDLSHVATIFIAVLVVIGVALPRAQAPAAKPKSAPKRPEVTVKATPGSGVVPVRISGVAELKGGDDDFEDYYCPTIEWNWDDGTVSESSNDCEPYEAGKTLIKRRYSVTHSYKESGHYRIAFRLKQKERIVGSATTVVQLLGGGY